MMDTAGSMDEALDYKPTITLQGKQLLLQKIEITDVAVGQEFVFAATARITGINQYDHGEGEAENSVTFELSGINMQSSESDQLAGVMYPNSPKPDSK
jgi:hypothetical protein